MSLSVYVCVCVCVCMHAYACASVSQPVGRSGSQFLSQFYFKTAVGRRRHVPEMYSKCVRSDSTGKGHSA